MTRPENLPTAETVVLHLGQLATCAGPPPRRGAAQGSVEIVEDGALAIIDERIVFAGRTTDLERAVTIAPATVVHDAPHLSAVPGFVDPHTHAVFAGDRRAELRQRLAGATYAQIAAAGGGIVSTVRATRAASEHELVAQSRPRLDEMLACGTTTCEVKSGYGLDLESELKMLAAIQQLSHDSPIDIVTTFMGAHEIPVEYRSNRDAYVALVVDRMIPEVASRGLAQWCDVFCETGVFTPAESTRILEAGSSRRIETADTRRRTRRQRGLSGRRAGWRAIGGSSGARRFGRHCRTRRCAGHRHAPPVRGLLLEAWAFRPSACTH